MARKSEVSSNPIRRVRLQNHRTLEQFSAECGIHLQALYLNEMGMYPTILPSILGTLSAVYGLNVPQLGEEYRAYVQEKRYDFGEEHLPYDLGEPSIAKSSIHVFRNGLGFSTAFGFAKAVCINPTLVRNVEYGKVEDFPGQLNLALRDIQVDPTDIEELQLRHQEYYGRNRFYTRGGRGRAS